MFPHTVPRSRPSRRHGRNAQTAACLSSGGPVAITRIASITIVSLLWSVAVLAAVPGPPAGLTASVSGNVVTLAWQAPSTGVVAGYVVSRARWPGGCVIATLSVAQPALVAPGVPTGVFYVRVRAMNAEGLGPVSNEVVASVP